MKKLNAFTNDNQSIYDEVINSNISNFDNLTEEEKKKKADLILRKICDKVENLSKYISFVLMSENPFLGNVILLLRKPTSTFSIETAATDGTCIYYNPLFFAKLTTSETTFILLHELYHVVLSHCIRIKSRDRTKWNIVNDYIVNYFIYVDFILKKSKLKVKLPEGALLLTLENVKNSNNKDNLKTFLLDNGIEILQCNNVTDDSNGVDSLICIDKYSSEMLYSAYGDSDSQEEDGDSDGQSPSDGNDSSEGQSPSDGNDSSDRQSPSDGNDSYDGQSPSDGNGTTLKIGDVEFNVPKCNNSDENENGDGKKYASPGAKKAENDIIKPDGNKQIEAKDILRRARDIAEKIYDRSAMSGSMKSIMDSIKEALKPSRIKWQTYLKRFLTSCANEDSSWQTPERKYLPHGIIMPGDGPGEKLEQVNLFVDCSGSITEKEVSVFLSQAFIICKRFDCTINVYYWHTSIADIYKDIENPKDVAKALPKQSGGTDINCVFDYVKKDSKTFKKSVILICTDGYCGYAERLPRWVIHNTIIAISEDGSSDLNNLKNNGKLVDLF